MNISVIKRITLTEEHLNNAIGAKIVAKLSEKEKLAILEEAAVQELDFVMARIEQTIADIYDTEIFCGNIIER